MDLSDDGIISVTRNFEWNVEKIENYLLSDIFEIFWDNCLTKWQIILYRKDDKIYAKLKKIKDYHVKFFGNFSINSLKQKNRKAQMEFDGEHLCDKWFHIHTIDYTEVAGCSNRIPVESFILQIKITLTQPESSYEYQPSDMPENFHQFLNSEKLSDLKIICSNGEEFPAHRFILLANAPVMYKMLNLTDHTNQIKVEDIHGKTMMEILRFLYTGEVILDHDDYGCCEPADLLECANKYEINNMQSCVIRSMVKNLDVHNAMDYYELAVKYDDEFLLRSCIFFIQKNYFYMPDSYDWYEFDSKIKEFLDIFYLHNEQRNPIYVLKTSMSCDSTNLPRDIKPFV